MDDLAAYLAGWTPEPVESAGHLDGRPSAAFAALLDQPPPGSALPGAELPPLWHWFHLLDAPAQAELGDDGHPAHGRFLPPIPDRRRMFAGGRLRVREPLRIGDVVTRRSSLVSATPKAGRSGALVFVTVRHEFTRGGASVPAVVEEQDFAYRSQPAGQPRVLLDPIPAGPAQPGIELLPDAAMLFRFSALTYNTHRIHYDHPYVTTVEGYPGLVVHGPLLALLLLELPRRLSPERRVAAFSYRLRRPAFAGTPVVATGGPAGEVSAGAPGLDPSASGSIRLA